MNTIIKSIVAILILSIGFATSCQKNDDSSKVDNLPDITDYPIVSTGQSTFFDNDSQISEPQQGEAFYGQNANYPGNTPSYTDNANGTITDNVTGLMWEKTTDKTKNA